MKKEVSLLPSQGSKPATMPLVGYGEAASMVVLLKINSPRRFQSWGVSWKNNKNYISSALIKV